MIAAPSCDTITPSLSVSNFQSVLTLCRRCFASSEDEAPSEITTCIALDGQAASVYYLRNPWLLCIERRPTLPERKLAVSPKISIHSSVVHYIENNNAPIFIDARSMEVDASVGTAATNMHGEMEFQFSPNYDRIVLRGMTYRFGSTQANIIKTLHAAYTSGNPWMEERVLLTQAGSKSQNLRELFKRHSPDRLFEKDGRGSVRLRL